MWNYVYHFINVNDYKKEQYLLNSNDIESLHCQKYLRQLSIFYSVRIMNSRKD